MKKVLVKLKHDMSGHSDAPPVQDKINCTCANRSNAHMNRNSHTESVTTFEVSINSHMCWQ